MVTLRKAARTLGFAAATAGILPVHTVHELFTARDDRERLKQRYKRAYCDAMLRLFGVTLDTIGEIPPMPRERGRLVVANHRSALDIPILLRTFGGHMLSRADVSGWPLLGEMAKRIGTVFVDRSSQRSGVAAIREIGVLLSAGSCVSVFAEGTTFEGDDIRPFQPGTFFAASRAGAEILPVGLAYEAGSDAAYGDETFLAHLGRVAAAKPSRAAIAIGAPMAPSERAKDSAERARERVGELVRVARARLEA